MPTYYPTAWVQLTLYLEDFGQSDPDRGIELSGHPLDFMVEINAFNKADTATVTVDFDDFPFDARILRGGDVKVFVADAGDLVNGDWWLAKSPDELRPLCIFCGVLDEPSATLDDKKRQIKLKCRDYTAYFLDATVVGDLITYEQGGKKFTFEEVLRQLLDQRDTTQEIGIRYEATVIYPADYKPRAKEATGGRRRRNGETIWDVVTQLALEAGLIVYVDRDEVVVREPQTIFVGDGDPKRLIQYVIGGDKRTVASFQQNRDLGRQHGINVQVTSYDPDAKKTLKAYSPKNPETEPKTEIPPSKIGKGKPRAKKTLRATVRPFVVSGITSQAQIQRIADQIREQLRHHELEGSIESSDMVDSLGRPAQEYRYGDPLEVAIAEDQQTFLGDNPEGQIRRLIAIGYGEQDAQAVVLALSRFEAPLYVHSVKHRFASRGDGGYQLTVNTRSRKQVDFGEDRERARAPKPAPVVVKDLTFTIE